jgi:hypothetical protein
VQGSRASPNFDHTPMVRLTNVVVQNTAAHSVRFVLGMMRLKVFRRRSHDSSNNSPPQFRVRKQPSIQSMPKSVDIQLISATLVSACCHASEILDGQLWYSTKSKFLKRYLVSAAAVTVYGTPSLTAKKIDEL